MVLSQPESTTHPAALGFASDRPQVMARSKKSKANHTSGEVPKKQFGKQLTHFLCFPLLSDEVLQSFGSSLEHFRQVSTTPAREHPLKARARLVVESQGQKTTPREANGDEVEVGRPDTTEDNLNNDALELEGATDHTDERHCDVDLESGPLGNTSKGIGETFEESLKIIPGVAHRPLGTYHMTIGVMNLSKTEDFQKAEEIFQGLNLKQLLKDAEKGPPVSSKVHRKWEESSNDKRKEKKEEIEVVETIKDLRTDTTSTLESLDRPVSPPTTSKTSNTNPQNQTTLTSTSANSTFQNTTSKFTAASELLPIHISLLGLSAFTSPKRARVLFAHPHEQSSLNTGPTDMNQRPSFDVPFPNRLYNFALHIEAPFREAGLITQTRPLTLHATLANMRFVVQAKGGRTSKGQKWTKGRKRWDEGMVDARKLCQVFNDFDGDPKAAENVLGLETKHNQEGHEDDDDGGNEEEHDGGAEDYGTNNDQKKLVKKDNRDRPKRDLSKEFIWAKDMLIDRVALCEMGAKKSENPLLELVYPPVLEKRVFE
ncbi:hypothetical protein H2198_010984 [Neophaeococcomyces mojaviensis]|uniref:Uncharacterized protein n=1 Tax=Neophaeococcomyces mojaviensis TaxID=3383035 RepID=A0ACC2ZMA2_9EURO|nr:hypothetical protein H2198_010984 [Knufia sp. JES_112]